MGIHTLVYRNIGFLCFVSQECVHVYIYIYIYIIYIYIYTYVNKYVGMYVHICMFVYIYVCISLAKRANGHHCIIFSIIWYHSMVFRNGNLKYHSVPLGHSVVNHYFQWYSQWYMTIHSVITSGFIGTLKGTYWNILFNNRSGFSATPNDI